MRIAMLTNNYKPFIGGVPISIERLSNGLKKLGHEVYIFAPSYENQIEEENVIRYKAFSKKCNGIVVPNIIDKSIEEKFKELKIDMIHVHHPMFIGWTALYLGKKYNIPVSYTYHTRFEQYLHSVKVINKLEEVEKNSSNSLLRNISKNILSATKEKLVPSLLRAYANRCDTVFAPTLLMKDMLEKSGVISDIEILPTGLDDEFFNENIERVEEIRNRYKGDKDYLFCTISRLSKEKNIEFIVDGLKKLKSEVGNCFKMIIIGDGNLKNKLKEKVNNLELEKNVVFLNSIPNTEIKDYCMACDAFLFASKSETQGIVLLEAMAAKNPIIAIKASGVVDVVQDGINGYMTEGNVDEWVSKIVYLINNEDERKKLSEGAYYTAVQYKSEKIAMIAQGYYEDILNGSYSKDISMAFE